MSEEEPRPVPGGGLLHPVPLVAIAVLVLNDHVLKTAWPGFVTGKLSDVAGMVFFPLLLQGLWEALLALLRRPWVPDRRVLIGTAVATGLFLASIQVFEPAAWVWQYGLGALQWPFRAAYGLLYGLGLPDLAPVTHVADPTDALTAPAVAIAVWAGWKRCAPVRTPR